ncbi:MAG: ATP-binding cassette domain-containing protein [Lachnospiraceae bacterium]|nr:ATP-binding cassette domain-containing protein [Lachnospiraceae bacterium]
MGWFEEQIKERAIADENVITDAFSGIAGAVMGKRLATSRSDHRSELTSEIVKILEYYHAKPGKVPDNVENGDEVLEYLVRPCGVMHRTVRLEKGWRRDAVGAMLGTLKEDGSAVALLPTLTGGYRFYDRKQGKYISVDKKSEGLIEPEAIVFYKPFPLRKMSLSSFFQYICMQVRPTDTVDLLIAMAIVTGVGMLVAKINSLLFSEVLASKSTVVLVGAGLFLAGVTISSLLFSVIRTLVASRIQTRMSVSVKAASMMRILSMPPSFFRDHNSGELSNRLGYISNLSDQLVSMVFNTTLGSLFSLAYVFQIFKYAPGLVTPAMIVTLISFLVTVFTILIRMRVTKKQMEFANTENGISYALISGIQKIRLSGAENRAFAKWANAYADQAALSFNPPLFLKVSNVIATAVSLAGTVVIYWFAIRTHVSVSDYYAFSISYGMVSAAFASLAQIVTSISDIKPTLEMIKPFFDTEPEISEEKEVVSDLKGEVEINNVTFAYDDDEPVLKDLSFKIKPGQYVAIVGKTGCGKSTLVRLLLGFETPQKGAVYYDGRDLKRLDTKSVRQKIGTVMQDGKLFSGDIYSNIVITAPYLTLDDAWAAAELAGIADDIRRMPMGMYTFISEGQGGISGGQKQRLMIARAVAPRPKILIFDEATSALDNITQKKVSSALDSMKCTRIVIAHRLSTIKQCDRIIVLDGGSIVEDGTYDELLKNNGFFAQLVARQRLETEES